jgi:hypothetical protein
VVADPPRTTPGAGGGPPDLPPEVWSVLDRSITVDYTSLTRAGAPVMVPVTPYVSDDRATLDVSTGLTYPTKAERARRNPKVALLYSDPLGSGLVQPPVVLVQGLATVRDADLQANTDRYIRLAMEKTPAAFQGQPKFLLRSVGWYFTRIWIHITPLRVWWWDSKAMTSEPGQWTAPTETTAPSSDPAPHGKQPAAWQEPPSDWRALARDAIPRLDQRSLAWVGPDGFPVSAPVLGLDLTETGLRLQLGRHLSTSPAGPACVTLHTHPEVFTGQENHTFVGQVAGDGTEGYDFAVERALADWSITGSRVMRSVGFLRKGRQLKPRLASEAARRGQPVPRVRLP